MARAGARLLACCALLAACGRPETRRTQAAPSASAARAEDSEIARALATLRREEDELRARVDFEALPPSSRSLGANPYAVVELAPREGARPGEPAFAALLRGDSRAVLLDARFNELGSTRTAPSPSGLAVGPGKVVFVASPLAAELGRYRIADGALEPLPGLPLPSGSVARAVAADARAVVVADFAGDRIAFAAASDIADAGALRSESTCRGPFRLELTPRWLGVACLFDHSIVLRRREAVGFGPELARITHDGPIWSFSLLEDGDELWVGAGGVEDHPLERRDKVFGYVDSFAYVYRAGARGVTRTAQLNLSELGVVTPKVARLERRAGKPWLTVLGYGSDRWVELALSEDGKVSRSVVHAGLPGCADAVLGAGGAWCANPLFDAWVELSEPPALHAARPPDASDPSARERLGEALFFTTLMAPDASSEGRLSRFTCETCHFEGGTDGRVHHSGRDAIRVSTRPLFGLFNAAPHFSRAHDPDLTSVSHNEFGVANRGNPVDPWFSLDAERFPWLAEFGTPGNVAPLDLRRALLAFLARFSHEENPVALERAAPSFTELERRGAELFRDRCARCHAARLVANDPKREVSFDRWEALVLSPSGPLVWSNGNYEKTGVEPYVERRGTRVPSLRRLYLKRPYLTNGSAATLAELLALARVSNEGFLHGGPAPAGASPLAVEERNALLAFLRLL